MKNNPSIAVILFGTAGLGITGDARRKKIKA
jgi:hypothetical protein